MQYNYRDLSFSSRNNSIACLRAKAQEHQARLLNNGGLFLQVRNFAQAQVQAQAQQVQQAQSEERNNNNCSSSGSNNQMLQLQLQQSMAAAAVKMEPTLCVGSAIASSDDVV